MGSVPRGPFHLDAILFNRALRDFARVLAERGVPFIFATGYAEDEVAAEFGDRPKLVKPFSQRDLEHAINVALLTGRGTCLPCLIDGPTP